MVEQNTAMLTLTYCLFIVQLLLWPTVPHLQYLFPDLPRFVREGASFFRNEQTVPLYQINLKILWLRNYPSLEQRLHESGGVVLHYGVRRGCAPVLGSFWPENSWIVIYFNWKTSEIGVHFHLEFSEIGVSCYTQNSDNGY